MRSDLLPLSLIFLAPAGLGCAGTVGGTGAGDAEAASTRPVVMVERVIDATNGSRAEASARFVRVSARSSLDDALRVIGASLDLPAPGACASTTSQGALAGDSAPIVELVDVGAVS